MVDEREHRARGLRENASQICANLDTAALTESAEAGGTAHLRVLEPGHRWYPRQLHDEQRREAARLRIPVAIEDEATGIAMVLIPGATYWMGWSPGDSSAYDDEKPRHQVTVEPFYAGIGPVLQEQWERVTGRNPGDSRGPIRPVEHVSFDDVRDFLKEANAGRSGRGLRLPSEAEWELAARGGTETCFWWGDDLREELANAEDGGPGEASDVGRYPANPYGLLDVLGNVWEWCEDSWSFWWQRVPTDGRAWVEDGELRVVRGGSWNSDSGCLRVSFRHSNKVDQRSDGLGFRLVRDAVIR